jgi:hypothetical protein
MIRAENLNILPKRLKMFYDTVRERKTEDVTRKTCNLNQILFLILSSTTMPTSVLRKA